MIENPIGTQFLDKTFISQLYQKLFWVRRTANETGVSLKAVEVEVMRQIRQANRGNPISGEGVTKSGIED